MNRKSGEPVATLETNTYGYAIRSALRRCGLFLGARSDNKVIGLRVPPDAVLDVYREAARTVLKSSEALDHYHIALVALGRRGDTLSEDAQDLLRTRSAVVVLIEHGTTIPRGMELAFDRIVDVGPVRPAHLISAAKEAWEMTIARTRAMELSRHPPRLLFAALRRGRPIDQVLAKLNAASGAGRPTKWEPRLEELEGYGQARAWGENLVSDLTDWRAGRIAWRDVDCGLLLSGPPGSGKTLFASALARSCGANFLGTSSAQWQAKGHLGDMLGAMRKSFRDAADMAPTILFVDEIDAIGDRRSFRGDNVGYSMQVVNALLELLDGSDGREGVVVVAATNFPGNLDEALRRPGRLDRHIVIGLPDQAARTQMLATHLDLHSGRPDALREAAKAMSGYSGALIAQVAKDARRIARRAGRDVAVADVLSLVPPLTVIATDERWESCVHEAGHAIVGLELEVGDLEFVAVAREVGHFDERAGHIHWKRNIRRNRRRQSYLDEIAMVLAGMAAEKVIIGDILDGSGGVEGSDLQRASDMGTLMLANLGLDSLNYCNISSPKELDELRRTDPILRQRVEDLLAIELRRAVGIVERRRVEVERLARAVDERGLLTGSDVREVITDC
ncbi:AAA family ATPase [Shinella sp.]|uniref:AAA family ATPase n=1 Tax=Shinella sp. TaxID=1870904 RepID=UPI002896F50D|nr:AAA family ATPase [Shinella sp.]